jgi:hypothetical protein
LEAFKHIRDIAKGQIPVPLLYLEVETTLRKVHLDVFVSLDGYLCPGKARSAQQKRDCVEMLVQEATVNILDTSQLCFVEDERHGRFFYSGGL